MALAKGSTLRATLEFVRADKGVEALERVLARLPHERRVQVERSAPTDEVAFDVVLDLWRAAEGEFGPTDPAWMERAGAQSIESSGVQHYGGILRKSNPTEFLTQGVSLFRLYYSPGNMEVVEAEPGRAVLRLVGFDAADPLFCRRQTGGLRRAVGLAGGATPTARHARCAAAGDAFCEWELTWK